MVRLRSIPTSFQSGDLPQHRCCGPSDAVEVPDLLLSSGRTKSPARRGCRCWVQSLEGGMHAPVDFQAELAAFCWHVKIVPHYTSRILVTQLKSFFSFPPHRWLVVCVAAGLWENNSKAESTQTVLDWGWARY